MSTESSTVALPVGASELELHLMTSEDRCSATFWVEIWFRRIIRRVPDPDVRVVADTVAREVSRTFDPKRGHLLAFLRSCAGNRVKDWMRRKRPALDNAVVGERMSDDPDPSHQFEHEDSVARVIAILETLDPDDVAIWRAFKVDELPIQRICERFGRTRSEVMRAINRVSSRLAEAAEQGRL